VAKFGKNADCPEDRPQVKAECLRLLATLRLDPARTRLISGFVDTYLRLTAQEEQVFQHEIGKREASTQESIMQIVTSWMEQGFEQGMPIQGIPCSNVRSCPLRSCISVRFPFAS
jgi:hypothetical protein